MTIHMNTLPDTAIQPPIQRPGTRNLALAATRLGLQLYARYSTEAAGKLVNQQFFKPHRLPMPSRYEYLLDEADSHTQLKHGAQVLPVYSWGDGPVILGVHGWGGAGIQFGAYIQPLVAAGYRVVLFDAPAHGRAQGERTNLYEMTAVVGKVARQIGPVHAVLAHSLGSIAAARAVVDGLAVQHLVMLAPPADLAAVVNGVADELQLPADVLANHRHRMEQQFGADVWPRLSLLELAPRLKAQGLVVVDYGDRSVPPDQSERVHQRWPGSQILRTQGLGHHRLLWDSDVVERVVGQVTASA
ncbi:alpha/beta fold hydrolase [Marinobacter caseinilyticus]|uniref:alpha/beta fold hydrolase n=1 Tax=Marinobacter caseinilyticus TaxID=2692195 RepID=UPI00140AB0BB|nr:alpha/beta hydrolase [Marinobacter caseinilyticus]